MLRRHGTKTLIKSLSKSDIRISKIFLDAVDAHLRATIKDACCKEKKSLNSISLPIVGTPPKPPIISRKAIDDYLIDINGPTKITKNFINELNTYAVAICIASLEATQTQTVTDIILSKKKVSQIPVTQRKVSDPIPKPPIESDPVIQISSGKRTSLAIKYKVDIQGVQIYGTQHLFTAKNKKQIEKSVTSIVSRHFSFIGVHGGVPIITIIGIDKQIEK